MNTQVANALVNRFETFCAGQNSEIIKKARNIITKITDDESLTVHAVSHYQNQLKSLGLPAMVYNLFSLAEAVKKSCKADPAPHLGPNTKVKGLWAHHEEFAKTAAPISSERSMAENSLIEASV